MRQVASFDDERAARLFADVLCAREIETEVSKSRAGSWDVWALREDQVEASRAAFAAFGANPAAPEHLGAAGCVERKVRALSVTERRSRHEVIDVRGMPGRRAPLAPLTLALAFASMAVTFATTLGGRPGLVKRLFIGLNGDPFPFFRVLRGEPWRLVTPIFIHMSVLHIFFNMLMLVFLGSALEPRIGAVRYAVLVVGTAAFSNAAEYAFTGNPIFGGMSGVVYALFAYAWIRGRLDPAMGLAVSNPAIVMMLVWLVIGFTGGAGPVANFAHLGGLLSGGVTGAVAAAIARRK